MLTFLLDPDFAVTAKLLDSARLFKQVVEALQIIWAVKVHWDMLGLKLYSIIAPFQNGDGKPSKSQLSHPAVKMWLLWLPALLLYYNTILTEALNRGYQTTMKLCVINDPVLLPWWVQWSRLIYSYQAMMNRKDPTYYSFMVPVDYHSWGYIWPHNINLWNLNAPLSVIAAPLDDHLATPIYCRAVMKSGTRIGQVCGMILNSKLLMTKSKTDGRQLCGRHRR